MDVNNFVDKLSMEEHALCPFQFFECYSCHYPQMISFLTSALSETC